MKSPQKVIETTRSAWSISEVARRNGVSTQFVRLEIGRGRLRAKQVSRRVLIPVDAEKDWLESAPPAAGQRECQ